MSTTYDATARHSITTFYGGDAKGVCVQITAQTALPEGEGYIQLTFVEAAELAYRLLQWVREETNRRQSLLKRLIELLRLNEKKVYKELAEFDTALLTCELNVDFVRIVDMLCPKNNDDNGLLRR